MKMLHRSTEQRGLGANPAPIQSKPISERLGGGDVDKKEWVDFIKG